MRFRAVLSSHHAAFSPTPSRRAACRPHPRCPRHHHRGYRGVGGKPGNDPLDIETALRAAAGQAYLVANSTTAGFEIVLGMPAWHAALADVGVTVEQNWAALAIRK